MPNAKEKQIQLDVVVLPKVHNLSVSITVPFLASSESITLLLGNNPCENDDGRCSTLHRGAEEAALAFALYRAIKEKLMGSPLEVARCKVDHVSCAAHENNFVISWNTQGTGSALRKTIGVVLKALQPNALFSKYGYNMKILGGKTDRAEFNYLANKMIEGITKSIHFVAIGKIKADSDFSSLLKTAANKYVASSKSPASECTAPAKHPEYKQDFPKVNCSDGVAAIIVADYIHHQGFGIRICGKSITIYSGAWNSKRDALKKKDRIGAYVGSKYSKLKDHAGLFLAYMANSTSMGSGSAVLGTTKKIDPVAIILKNI